MRLVIKQLRLVDYVPITSTIIDHHRHRVLVILASSVQRAVASRQTTPNKIYILKDRDRQPERSSDYRPKNWPSRRGLLWIRDTPETDSRAPSNGLGSSNAKAIKNALASDQMIYSPAKYVCVFPPQNYFDQNKECVRRFVVLEHDAIGTLDLFVSTKLW